MIVKRMEKITEQRFNDLSDLQKSNISKFKDKVADIAVESGYHPVGYGFYNPSLLKENNNYYAVWESSDSCD